MAIAFIIFIIVVWLYCKHRSKNRINLQYPFERITPVRQLYWQKFLTSLDSLSQAQSLSSKASGDKVYAVLYLSFCKPLLLFGHRTAVNTFGPEPGSVLLTNSAVCARFESEEILLYFLPYYYCSLARYFANYYKYIQTNALSKFLVLAAKDFLKDYASTYNVPQKDLENWFFAKTDTYFALGDIDDEYPRRSLLLDDIMMNVLRTDDGRIRAEVLSYVSICILDLEKYHYNELMKMWLPFFKAEKRF